MKDKNFFQRMAQLIAIFGLSLLIGNISAFIAMNMLSIPKDTLFFLWQRQFIDAMVQLGMIKGMWLLFIYVKKIEKIYYCLYSQLLYLYWGSFL